jgi:flagellar motor switch protein FliN/FliY
MTGLKTLDKFLDAFNSNASGVLSTITNQTIEFEVKNYSDFSFESIEANIPIPCLLCNITFASKSDFQMNIIIAKELAASLADLMMLGTGDAEYNEEHNDALQELFNQVLGSLKTELDGDGIAAAGTVQEVQLTDMELHKEFMSDNKMIELGFELLGNPAFTYLIFDPTALKTMDDLIAKHLSDSSPMSNVGGDFGGSSGVSSAKSSGPAVSVQRASFAEIEEVRPSNSKNINIDHLMDIPLPVTVELGSKDMRIKEILGLGQGSVVELNKLAGDLVDLKINGKKFAVGEVMVVDENYAVRIVSLISREERIRTLGAE